MITPTVCIFHGDCADGFAAAWAVWRRFGDAVKFYPGVYGQDPPPVTGEDVLLVDFSYKRPVMELMAMRASSVTVFDHHKTAEADLAPLLQDRTVLGQFDMTRSGAMITWHECHPREVAPILIHHIQDRDLWRFDMPNTREIQACVFSCPYKFKVWDRLVDRCADDVTRHIMVAEGTAILRAHDRDIEQMLSLTKRPMVIGGFEVMVGNIPKTHGSDAAGMLAEDYPFGACYYDCADARVFSLRSRKGIIDVATIAERYGGGGHAGAAGFQAPPGWEGDIQL